ncbi:phosphodiester glycosidase family protein [Kovacikia minuta CCNUW1]|uniref:phosphodiester glycosidase family protein n=1 Tax=Kovacikia minuta TaxID=2931930 RepID=UPI001CCB2E5F|nr:phosphodiester glycosidase family protein [Kovacikia minuta]UBF27927.1 phosphodiester glycosidase family protein [Kovacikia minuta CCNUW1]
MSYTAFLKSLSTAFGIGLLGVPLLIYGVRSFQRPPQTNLERSLFQGVAYKREYRPVPRPLMLHIVTIDLNAPGIRVLVTPGTPASDQRETNARTPSEFLNEFNLQLAINANFFYPFREKTPWDYYPHSGDRVNAVGQAISNQLPYSSPQSSFPALCFSDRPLAQIGVGGTCPDGTAQAVAGSSLLVSQGKPVPIPKGAADSNGLYSRTGVGLDQQGKKIWIVAIDDKQPFYSEGVTLEELAGIFVSLGVYNALNLDGGGSTTLAISTSTGPQLLNAPIHTKVPMRERPVANHLGFYALPAERGK